MMYGSANKYRPVNRSTASGSNGEYVNHGGGVPPRDKATKFAITVTVKTIDTHRCNWRIPLFQLTAHSPRQFERAYRQSPIVNSQSATLNINRQPSLLRGTRQSLHRRLREARDAFAR